MDKAARTLFIVSTVTLFFTYGVFVGRFHLFPYQFLKQAVAGFQSVYSSFMLEHEWYYVREPERNTVVSLDNKESLKGLNLVTRVAGDHKLSADIVDMENRTIHHWDLDWFTIWPDAKHIEKKHLPKTEPGTHIHGAVVMKNGDLVFNFEHLGLVRLDRNGKVVWRLPYRTHHSVHQQSDGNLWVCGQRKGTNETGLFPHREMPFTEYTILEVSPDGSILNEWSVAEILVDNGYKGLLYLGTLDNTSTQINGDLLHFNDVEPFSDNMEEDFFVRGDVLVSLRNINTVFVFNTQSGTIKYISTGRFVRQHDPDFIDGNRFSVFDNNNIAPEEYGHQSRIAIVSVREGTVETYFEGNDEVPFYTDIAGKHQWLANGNLLITEARKGRAFELNQQGKVVWQYKNYVEDGIVGLLEEVRRLPQDFDTVFNSDASQKVQTDLSN